MTATSTKGFHPHDCADATMHRPTSIDEAVSLLGMTGSVALSGGTWLMRGSLRNEEPAEHYVALDGLAELQALKVDGGRVQVGATVTMAELARGLPSDSDLSGVALAAGAAASVAVREMATVGGTLAAMDFPAADLPPALLCLDAVVHGRTATGDTSEPLADFLNRRGPPSRPWLLTRVVVDRCRLTATHVRQPLRKAGDYPVAIVSMAVDDPSQPSDVRVAIGSVEATPRRWSELEALIRSQGLQPHDLSEWVAGHLKSFTPRRAPGLDPWYRTALVPSLVRRAATNLVAVRDRQPAGDDHG